MTVEDLETRLRQAFAVRAETTTTTTTATDTDDRAAGAEDRNIAHRTIPMASVADRPSRRTLASAAITVAAVLVAGILIIGSRHATHQGVLSSTSNPPCTSPTSPDTPNSVTITHPAPAPEAPVADP